MAFVIIASFLAVALFLNVSGQIEKHYKESFKSAENNKQAKDETADWLVYENKKYGYRMKYPKNWGFKDFDKNGKIEIEKKLPEINSLGGHDYGLISIEVVDAVNFDSLEQWIDQNYSINESQRLRFKKEIKINNHNGIYREITNSVAGGYQNDAYILADNKIFKIKIDIYIANFEVQDKYKKTLDSILNTLEFID